MGRTLNVYPIPRLTPNQITSPTLTHDILNFSIVLTLRLVNLHLYRKVQNNVPLVTLPYLLYVKKPVPVCDFNLISRMVDKQMKPGDEMNRGDITASTFLRDYLEGAAYSTGGADRFTLGTPVTLYGLNNGYHIVCQHQSLAVTHTDA